MEIASTSTSDAVDVLKRCLAGGTAAAFSKTTTAPFDRVKLLLQLSNTDKNYMLQLENHGRSMAHPYNGMRDCLRRVSIEQGVLSLWRGNCAGVMRCFPNHALNFALRDFYRNLLLKGVDRQRQFRRFVAGSVACGGLGGATALLLLYPFDFARTRLAVDVNADGSKKFKGMVHCLGTIRKREGWLSWYRGFNASVQFVIASRAAFFGLFDVIRTSVADPKQLHFFTTWLLAQVCLISSGLLCYPLDTVRRQMMMQAGKRQKMFSSSWSCWMHIARSKGYRGFYRGALTNSFRSTGGALIITFYYEFAKYL
ncbi:putative ADP/ATP translocase 2 [Cooperia oncophora]